MSPRARGRSAADLGVVLGAIARTAARLCEARDALIFLVDGDHHRLVARHGNVPQPEPLGARRLIRRDTPLGRALLDRKPVHVRDLGIDVKGRFKGVGDLYRVVRVRTLLAMPLQRDRVALGGIVIRRTRVQPFTAKQIALLKTFADQAAIAIENVRLFTELQARNQELTEALEQQTATSEILRVISRSPTDVQPVFDTIIANAVRLCGALHGLIWRYYGDVAHLAGSHNILSEELEEFRREFPRRIQEGDRLHHLTLSGAVINIPDLEAYREAPPATRARLQARGVRSLLIVPMRRGSEIIGTIGVSHRDVNAFSASRVELLKTFADQAVLAIENVRLFNELQTRTQELTRSVGHLTALGEVGQAVSSTLDLETVLTTIVSRAVQLTGSDGGTIFEYDEVTEQFHQRVTERLSLVLETDAQRRDVGALFRPWAAALRSPLRIKKGEGVVGRLPETRKPIQVGDIAAAGAYQGPLRDALLESGIRAVLTVPLMSEDRLVGALTVNRKTAGVFSAEVIELLTTFAAQSAIAIQNARLFREIEAKGRELEVASRHKSQFLANMSHELRTPMNAILGYTELITDGIYGVVPEPMRDVLTRVDASGRHLLGLINDVLDLSKIEAGQLSLTLADYSMKEVVETVVAAVESLVADKRLRLVVDLAPELPTGRGDQRRLAQVLLNLVGNAIKFAEQGQIAVRVGTAAGLFTVAVSDTGPGIAPADQERIFEEFQQADTSTTRPKGGTGLGLAIARRIVAMHGGRIWVESAPGEGATFRFTIPVRVDEQMR